MILIIDRDEDRHARAVCDHLVAMGDNCVIADVGDCGTTGYVSNVPGDLARSEWRIDDGRRIVLEDVDAVWIRRFRTPEVAKHPLSRYSRFVSEEWIDLMVGSLLQLDVPIVNPPQSQFTCPKPIQLKIATEVGLAIPPTLITNDPRALLEFRRRSEREIIHKSFRMLDKQTIPAERLRDEHLEGDTLQSLRVAPVIFQALVPKRYEVRVVAVRDRLFAARCRSPGHVVDSRLVRATRFDPIELPRHVARGIHELMARLGLFMGAIDLVIDDQGEFFFLEVNPQGQFLYIEELAKHPIAEAIALMLHDFATTSRRPVATIPSSSTRDDSRTSVEPIPQDAPRG